MRFPDGEDRRSIRGCQGDLQDTVELVRKRGIMRP
jgi:hypothetical protein